MPQSRARLGEARCEKLPLGSLEQEQQRERDKRQRSLRGCGGGVPSRSNDIPLKEQKGDSEGHSEGKSKAEEVGV